MNIFKTFAVKFIALFFVCACVVVQVVKAEASAPTVLLNNELPSITMTDVCTTSLIAGTNFSSFSVQNEYYNSIDEINYIEGDTEGIVLHGYLQYVESNESFHTETNPEWDYCILSNPNVLNEDYIVKTDGVNRLIVAPKEDPNGQEFVLFTYTVYGLEVGSDVRVEFDVERLNAANAPSSTDYLWQYMLRANSGSSYYDPIFYNQNQLSANGATTLTYSFTNIFTSSVTFSFIARHTDVCEAVAFSNINVYGCLDKYIITDDGYNTACEGAVIGLNAVGLDYYSGDYTWERKSSSDGAWTVISGATTSHLDAEIDLGSNYFRVTRDGQSMEKEIMGGICCSADAGRQVLFHEDFGTVTQRTRNEIIDNIGVYTFAASDKVYDNFYCVVSNLDQADPGYCGWPGNKTDHTGNTNGAFLVVNAGNAKTMFYEMSLGSEFCENTYYTMSLYAANLATSAYAPAEFMFEVVDKSTNNEETVLNQWYTGAIIGYNEEGTSLNWNRYSFSFYPEGTTELFLRIYSTSDETEGNDFALDDIIVTTCSPDVTLYSDYANGLIDLEVECGESATLTAVSKGDITSIFNNPYYYWQVSYDDGATWQTSNYGYGLDQNAVQSKKSAAVQSRVIVAQSKEVAEKLVSGTTPESCELYVISNVATLTCNGCNTPTGLNLTTPQSTWCAGSMSSLSLNASVEAGETEIFTWSGYNAASGQWVQLASNTNSGLTAAATISDNVDAYSKYKVVVGVDDCVAEQEISVSVNALPDAAINAETSVLTCDLTSIDLNAVTSFSDVSYAWSTGSTASSITATESGEYSLIVTDNSTGCESESATYTITNSVIADGALEVSDYSACAGSVLELSASSTLESSNVSFLWYADENLTEFLGSGSSISITVPSADASYYVALSGEGICDNTSGAVAEAYVSVSVPIISVELTPEKESVNMGEQTFKELVVYPLDASYTSIWYANGMVINPDDYFPATIYTDYEYTVSVIDECGNTLEATATTEAVWATLLTPYDADGYNDNFMADVEDVKLEVFDRYGNRVYSGNGGWMQADIARNMPGVYFYVAKFGNGDVKKGAVELFRK